MLLLKKSRFGVFGGICIFFLFAAMSSLHYERLCLLFNVGVLQGQIAAAQNFQSDEGLKAASKMFQVLTVHVLESV